MTSRHTFRVLASLSAVLLSTFACDARADLYGFTISADPRGMGITTIIAQYDDDGRFVQTVPQGAYALGESVGGLAATPDGWVYFTSNLLGNGNVHGFRPDDPGAMRGNVPNAMFTSPGGLTVGPDGALYTASNANSRGGTTGVLRYDQATGVLTPVVFARPLSGFTNFANSVAVAPTGDVYLGRNGVGVERYAAGTGEFVSVVVPVSGNVNDVEIGPDGNLYLPTDAGISRYDARTGAPIDVFIPNGSGGLSGARDLSFGGDGAVYVNSPATNQVLRYDATTGAFRDVFITPEQYTTGHLSFLTSITYVVPEPGAAAAVFLAAPLLLRRRRTPRAAPRSH